MSKTLNELFDDLIFLNECAGNKKYLTEFSDPDGVRSGKSGWSFGRCQFDTKNNDQALACLRECGFTEDEIKGIVNQTIDVKPLEVKLVAHQDIIEKYDTAQLSKCLNSALNACTSHGVPMNDYAAILAAADAVNQYGSVGDGFIKFMNDLKRPFTVSDVLEWRLQTTYGKSHSEDCKRRINNIYKITGKIVA